MFYLFIIIIIIIIKMYLPASSYSSFQSTMHCGEPISFKATAARAAAAAVAKPHFGRRRQRLCSTEFYGLRSQSSHPKLPSIPSKTFQRGILSACIPRAAKDDDAMAQPTAGDPGMPEKWPGVSKMKVDPEIEDSFFNRKDESSMVMEHLNRKPKEPLLLLGPKNSGKSVSQRQLSINTFIVLTQCIHQLNMPFSNMNHAGIIEIDYRERKVTCALLKLRPQRCLQPRAHGNGTARPSTQTPFYVDLRNNKTTWFRNRRAFRGLSTVKPGRKQYFCKGRCGLNTELYQSIV
jgi:hypothetical protein